MRVTHGAGNLLQDPIGIGQHLVVPETQHPIASLGQKISTMPIRLSLEGVVTAVELDHHSAFRATELGVGLVTSEAPGTGPHR